MKSAIGLAVFSAAIFCLGVTGPLVTSSLSADMVYCDVIGTNVSFVDISESTTGGGLVFGQPAANGDGVFSPGTGLLSQSAGGGISLVDGRLQMTIEAAPGFEFDRLDIDELGSYFGFGAGAVNLMNSLATVEADGNSYTGDMMMSFNGPGQGAFSGGYSISFPSTDRVQLTLNNQLLSASGAIDAAYVDVSSVRISVNSFASSVPEPSSLSVALLAAFALIKVRRRRSI